MKAPRTFSDVVNLWPTAVELGNELGLRNKTTAKQWRIRNYIPAEFWADIIANAKRRGYPGVTPESLTAMAARREKRAELKAAA